MKDFLRNNLKVIIAFIIGVLVSGVSVYAAGELFASNITYDNSTSGLTSTDVQSAINELNTKSNTWVNPTTFGISMNRAKTIIATNGGIIIRRNGTTHLIRNNNWSVEKDHLQQIYTGVTCTVQSARVSCDGSDISCSVYSAGIVSCTNESDYSYCSVNQSNGVTCT